MPSLEEIERLAREERSVKALEKIAQELEAIETVLLNLHGEMKEEKAVGADPTATGERAEIKG